MQAVMIANVIWYTMKTCMLRGSSQLGRTIYNFKSHRFRNGGRQRIDGGDSNTVWRHLVGYILGSDQPESLCTANDRTAREKGQGVGHHEPQYRNHTSD